MTVPGALLLDLVRHRARGWTRWALAVGLSVALWPLALHWGTLAGARWQGGWLAAGLLVGGALAVAGAAVRARTTGRPRRAPSAATVAVALVLILAVGLRVVQARSLVVPAWVDGLHHTVVTAAIARQGIVPMDLAPYVEVGRFYYHFGFHALAAAVALVSGAAAPAAVLWTGQALSGAAALTVYALARRLTTSSAAAIAAAAVPATLYAFPAYFVSWSRYTQLAGLVALPVAWLLLADATRVGGRRRDMVLAGTAAAGLALVHYRVTAFFLLGAFVWLGWLVLRHRPAAGRLAAVAGSALVAAVLAGPWLVSDLVGGARALADASPGWLAPPEGVAAVPAWLFTTHTNALWIGLAVRGVAIGLARQRAAAAGVAATLGLAVLAVRPGLLGLPESWVLTPFSLAIALYLPVALGVALLVDAALDLAPAGPARRRAGRWALPVVLVVAAAGAVETRDILNPATAIARPADLEAARWVAENTPADARFLVSTTHWHLGTYRGLDGGYWLPVLAGRAASIPPALYPYGPPARVREIDAVAAEAARGEQLAPAELSALMDRVGADHVYVGPASEGEPGRLGPAYLREMPFLEELYAADGVHVFRRR